MEPVKVDVLIPSYKPKERFLQIIDRLEHQTYPVHKIIVVNTEEKYMNNLIYGHIFENEHNMVSITNISKMEFDHAKVRRDMVSRSEADIFICMTDDALPKDQNLIANLIEPILSKKAQASYARQLPNKDCKLAEAYSRIFNYPPKSRIKGKEDEENLGIKTYFFSDVCAAYDRKIYDEIGGFVDYAIFNEDMIYAHKLLNHGYKIAYVAEAQVYHSHNYSNKEYFKRNFDLGVSQAEHPEVFSKLSSGAEGKKLVFATIKYLSKHGKWYFVPGFIVTSACKFLGFKLGKNYEKLPESLVKKCTLNTEYWMKKNIRTATKNINPYSGYGMSKEERK
ncbi:MAG: glycosyltransferase [Lachnospiraceae bacterium]|nr:glycosyltransferase [Lachnospiraceae bacterium]